MLKILKIYLKFFSKAFWCAPNVFSKGVACCLYESLCLCMYLHLYIVLCCFFVCLFFESCGWYFCHVITLLSCHMTKEVLWLTHLYSNQHYPDWRLCSLNMLVCPCPNKGFFLFIQSECLGRPPFGCNFELTFCWQPDLFLFNLPKLLFCAAY